MDDIMLLASTGAGPVDTIVRAVLARFEATFPQRVHSGYVISS